MNARDIVAALVPTVEDVARVANVWDKHMPRVRDTERPVIILDDMSSVKQLLIRQVAFGRNVYLPPLQSRQRALTYNDLATVCAGDLVDMEQRLNEVFNSYVYRFKLHRTALSKAIVKCMLGINVDDLNVSINAAHVNNYIEMDAESGTIKMKRQVGGTFETARKFLEKQKR